MECKLPAKSQSNEEVIDELTKGLEKSCTRKGNNSEDEKNGVTNEDDTKSETTDGKNDQQEDEYFVDETILKDRDVDLTDEQKEEFKCKSESMKIKGNNLFRDKDYIGATSIYTEGLKTCPLCFQKERAILYANRAAAKAAFMTDKYSAIIDCTNAIELDPNYVKAYLRRAHFYEEADKLEEALVDYKKVITFDPTHTESICAVKRLEPIVQERNEKLKAEMMSKLKDIGNMILKPFGLSTSNFQLQKDENSGGYSVKFNQNTN